MRILPFLVAALAAIPAQAQDAAPGFPLELNAVQPSDNGCRVTFLASNQLGQPLARAALEMALFDKAGSIERIVTLDFKDLSPGKTKVLQFDLAGLDCADLGRILVNDVTACEGEGLAPDACLAGLTTSARPDIVFGL